MRRSVPIAAVVCTLVVLASVGAVGVPVADGTRAVDVRPESGGGPGAGLTDASSAATVTPTPTPTPTGTETATPSPTPTPTGTETSEPTPSATSTSTSTVTETATSEPASSPASTSTATGTETSTPSATPTETPASTPSQTATATPSPTPSPTPTSDSTGTTALPADGVVTESGAFALEANRTNAGVPGVAIRASDVTIAGDGHLLRRPWSTFGTGVRATNESVDDVTLRNLTVRQYGRGIEATNATTLSIRDVDVRATNRGIAVANASTVVVENTSLTATTAGEFRAVDTLSLRNVSADSLVVSEGTRVEASNVSVAAKRRMGFTARNVALRAAQEAPRPPSNRTRAGPSVVVRATEPDAHLTVSLPARAPPETPDSSVAVWAYDGNWSALPTTRVDGRLVASVPVEANRTTLSVLGAAEPRLVPARSSAALSATVGGGTTETVTVRNVGSGTFPLENVTLRGQNASRFSVVNETFVPSDPKRVTPTSGSGSKSKPAEPPKGVGTNSTTVRTNRTDLPPGSSYRVTVSFAPESTAPARATVVFDRADHAARVTVPLVGTATTPDEDSSSVSEADVTITPTTEDDYPVDDDDEIVVDENGRRLLRVTDNLYLVLNPSPDPGSHDPPPEKSTPSTPPSVGLPTVTATPTVTASPTLSPTASPTLSPTPTASPTLSPTPTASPTLSPTPTTARSSTPEAGDSTPSSPATSETGPQQPTGTPPPTVETASPATPVEAPGFGVVPVVVSLATLVLVMRRSHRE